MLCVRDVPSQHSTSTTPPGGVLSPLPQSAFAPSVFPFDEISLFTSLKRSKSADTYTTRKIIKGDMIKEILTIYQDQKEEGQAKKLISLAADKIVFQPMVDGCTLHIKEKADTLI